MGFIGRALQGETQLWKAFWLLPIEVLLLDVLFTAIIFFVCLKFHVSSDHALFYFMGPSLIVPIICWIAVWRCAFNCIWQGWGYIARIHVILGVILFICNIVYYIQHKEEFFARVNQRARTTVMTPDDPLRRCNDTLNGYAIKVQMDPVQFKALPQAQAWMAKCMEGK